MTWSITTPDGKTHEAKRWGETAIIYTTSWNCPACNTNGVRLGARTIESRDTYVMPAVCDGCGEPSGEVRLKVDTLFGLEEDEAVLLGRARVYG